MLRFYAGERTQVAQSKLVYRGYDIEVKRAASGWRVGIYPRTADLPILGRCEVFAADPDEAVVIAKDRVDGANNTCNKARVLNAAFQSPNGGKLLELAQLPATMPG